MNVPLLPEILALRAETPQTELPLAAEGVLRYVWNNRWGSMLIEVKDGQAFVNGCVVTPLIHVVRQPCEAFQEG